MFLPYVHSKWSSDVNLEHISVIKTEQASGYGTLPYPVDISSSLIAVLAGLLLLRLLLLLLVLLLLLLYSIL